jgi:hypothetical protein
VSCVCVCGGVSTRTCGCSAGVWNPFRIGTVELKQLPGRKNNLTQPQCPGGGGGEERAAAKGTEGVREGGGSKQSTARPNSDPQP